MSYVEAHFIANLTNVTAIITIELHLWLKQLHENLISFQHEHNLLLFLNLTDAIIWQKKSSCDCGIIILSLLLVLANFNLMQLYLVSDLFIYFLIHFLLLFLYCGKYCNSFIWYFHILNFIITPLRNRLIPH